MQSFFRKLKKSGDDVRRTNRNRINKSRAEIVVAIMGLTGAGKSSFIQTVTGNRNVRIGHELNSGVFLRILLNYILFQLR
jgi:50S ribosomal subunit-associated GTPase HflX